LADSRLGLRELIRSVYLTDGCASILVQWTYVTRLHQSSGQYPFILAAKCNLGCQSLRIIGTNEKYLHLNLGCQHSTHFIIIWSQIDLIAISQSIWFMIVHI
jgi:hypothetical protein